MGHGPLVEPTPDLRVRQRSRYARHLLLDGFGMTAQRRLLGSRVAVVGAGGLGSPVLAYLAAAGVGHLTIIDDDTVDLTNLQRQVVHGTSDVDRLKVASAAETVEGINRDVEVAMVPQRLCAENAAEVLRGHHLVVDGADSFATRYLVSDVAGVLGIPHVWGSISEFAGQVSVWWAGTGPCYRCVFPRIPPPGSVPACGEAGVLGAVCGVIGSVMATEAVKLLTGTGEALVGTLLLHDALAQTWDRITVAANPECARCGHTPTVTEISDEAERCGVDDPQQPASATADPVASQSRRPMVEPVPAITAEELAVRLAARQQGRDRLVVVDVRSAGERDIVSIPGSVPIALSAFTDSDAGLSELGPTGDVVMVCRSGVRSAQAARALQAAGRPGVFNLAGGVLAWVDEVDPTLPRY